MENILLVIFIFFSAIGLICWVVSIALGEVSGDSRRELDKDDARERLNKYRNEATDIRCAAVKAHALRNATTADMEAAFALAKFLEDLASSDEELSTEEIEKRINEFIQKDAK